MFFCGRWSLRFSLFSASTLVFKKSWITRVLHWLEVLRSSSTDTRYGCVSKWGTSQICLKCLVFDGISWISDLPILRHIQIFRRFLGSIFNIFNQRILTPTPPEHTLEAAAPTSTVRSNWGSNLWAIHPSLAMKLGRWEDWKMRLLSPEWYDKSLRRL